ncbi:MAG: phosphatase PAP2 family protein [Lachnospiraceae bacterium]|nr:phosphatase PAP2 family protein [Lachnospiraceae bacterium]
MDISILLALQEFRNGAGSILADFMLKMTFLGELNTALVIMAVLYWCVNKDLGTYLLMGWSGNRLVNGALKVTVCAYRPWIRNPQIVPYGDSITTATGYSFPSGHTMNAASVFGGGAVRKDMPGKLRIALGIVVVLIGFSRNYLGVHTPQDVLVGMAAGMLVMWLVCKMMRYLGQHPEKALLVMCIGIGLAVLVAVYAALKKYPEDFDAEGKLIVDGAKMANDTFKGVGWCCAFLIGWILERSCVRFSTEVPLNRKLIRVVVGLIGYYALSLILLPLIKEGISGPVGTTLSCFLQMFYIAFLFPACMKYVERGV